MRRHGLTLMEMAVALVSSGVLVAGLASALYMATKALPPIDSISRQEMAASAVLCDVMADVGMALSFSERSATAITFTVPDRDGDSLVETIRYAWSGTAGDPLTYQYNGGAAFTIATDVQAFNLEALTRELVIETSGDVTAGNVVLEEVTVTKAASNVTTVALTKPPGTDTGSLLVAALALDGNAYSSVTAPAGWTLIHKGPQGVSPIYQTFAVWWKIATDAEPTTYSFTWSPTEQAYGWIMRFSGHNTANPINASAAQSGSALVGPSPAVTTTVANAMVVRLVGADGSVLPSQLSSLVGHTFITNDGSSTSLFAACTGTAGYLLQPTPGDSGVSTFNRSSSEEYTSVTIAIAPAVAE